MAEIKEYVNKVEGLRPTETGVESTASAARRIGSNYNEAGAALQSVAGSLKETGARFAGVIKDAGAQAVEYAEHREVSHGAVAYAGLTDKLTQQWNETAKNADPNDPTVAQKFREEVVEPQLEKYRDGFWTEGGAKYAEHRVEALRTEMLHKTTADMGTLAAAAVTQNVRQMSNTLSNTAMSDPSSVPHSLEAVDASVKAIIESSPNIKGVTAQKASIEISQKMRESIVKAGAIGAIQKSANPEKTAEDWGKKYPEYISGDELKMLSANARQQIRADRQDRAYQDHIVKVEAQDRSDKTETGYLQKLYSDDEKERAQVSTKAIVNDPNLTRQSKERMIGVVEREMKPETAAKISNGNYVGILADIRSGKISDVGPIFEARIAGKLNRADFNQAIKDVSEYKSPNGEALSKDRAEFFKRYGPAIDPAVGSTGLHSALGNQKMYEAEKAARRAEEDARKSGKDPHSVYDPDSPNFFGKPANIMKYRPTLQDTLNYQGTIEKKFVPPSTWELSPSRNQYRDPSTKKIYNVDGTEAGK